MVRSGRRPRLEPSFETRLTALLRMRTERDAPDGASSG
jgi:hypothetical protein